MLKVTSELKRVLKKTGTMWWNHGDCYNSSQAGNKKPNYWMKEKCHYEKDWKGSVKFGKVVQNTMPTKCQMMQNYRLAIRMVDEQGWILRNQIIWHKPNCMPSSVKDRFTVDFEPVFFFVKSKEKSSDIKIWLPTPFRPEEAAWLAAIIDGEGTIGIRRSKRPNQLDTFNAYLTMTNSCKELVERCIEITGMGTIREDSCGTNLKMWRWEISHNKAISVIGEIYSYLIQKKEQAKIAIEIQKLAKTYGGRSKGVGIRVPKEVYEKKKALWKLCKKLNQRIKNKSGLKEPNLNRIGGCEDYWFEMQYEKVTKSTLERDKYGRNSYGGGLKTGMLKRDSGKMVKREGLGRNKRTVWKIATKPFKEAHFATFPPKLITPMIKAGCPEFICLKCGKAREKMWDISYQTAGGKGIEKYDTNNQSGGLESGACKPQSMKYGRANKISIPKGYTDCNCKAGWTSGIVLDPFMGSGTTAWVARSLGRQYLGIELNKDYIKMAEKRLQQQTLL